MAQNDYESLLIRLEDTVDFIRQYQFLLKLAYEEIENPNEEMSQRVEILLSTYLSQVEPHFDAIQIISNKRIEMRRTEFKKK